MRGTEIGGNPGRSVGKGGRMPDDTATAATLEEQVAQLEQRIATVEAENRALRQQMGDQECSCRFFQSFVEQSPDAMSMLRLDDERTVYMNAAACSLAGHTDSTWYDRPFTEVFQFPSVQKVRTILDQARQHGAWQGEVAYQLSDGNTLQVPMHAVVVQDDGQPPMISVVVRGSVQFEHMEALLARKRAILETFGKAAVQFLHGPDLHQNVQQLLERLGTALDTSQACIFQNQSAMDGDRADTAMVAVLRYCWTKHGGVRNAETLYEQPWHYAEARRWQEMLSQEQSICGNIGDFPAPEQALLARFHIQSLLLVPIFVNQQWWGFILLQEQEQARIWTESDQNALHVVAGIVGAALHRAKNDMDLRRQEQQLEMFYLAIEQSASGMMIADPQGIIEYVNPRFTQITGYTAEEVVGKPIQVLQSAETSTRKYLKLWATISAGRQWRSELRSYRRRTNEVYWLGASILPITDEQGTVTHFLAVGQDITERKRSEETLRSNLQFLATLLDTIPSPVFYQNREGRYLGCNQVFASLVLGLPKDSIIGRRLSQLPQIFPPEKAGGYYARDMQLIRDTGVQKYEAQVQCADGVTRDFIFSKATFTDASNEVAGIIGVMLDISDRKRIEEALRKSEERFRLLAENARDMIFRYRLTHPRGFEYVSPSVTSIMGYTPEEYYTDPDIDLKSLHPTSLPVFNVFTRSSETYQDLVTMRYVRKDGKQVWIEQNSWQVFDDEGNAIAIEGISRDITERVGIETALRIQHDLAVGLSSASDLKVALNQGLMAGIQTDEIDCGGVYLVDKQTGDLHMTVQVGFSDDFLPHIAQLQAGSHQVQMLKERKVIYQRFPEVLLGPFDLGRWNEGLRSVCIVPVHDEKDVLAALYLASHTHDDIPVATRTLVEAIAAQMGSVIARLEAETALRESQNNLQTLFDTLDDFLFIFDVQGYILHMNPVMEKWLGYAPMALQKVNVLDIHSLEQRDEAMAMLAAEASDEDSGVWLIPLVSKDGEQIPVETRVKRGRWNKQDVFFGISRDITERQRVQSQLLQQEHSLAVLRERERLARELHDSIGQVLGYANTQAQAISTLLGKGKYSLARSLLKKLVEVIQDSQADVRQFILGVKASTRLYPDSAHQDKGFFHALREYLERVAEFYGLHTELVTPPDFTDGVLSSTMEVQLLRIVQEALTNVRKHANAQTARILFHPQRDFLTVTIEDDGEGFERSQMSGDSDQSYGLHSMSERAKEIGGSLDIDSKPGHGTRVMVYLPLRSAEGVYRKIMLVDDHPLFLEGIRNLLSACGLEVIGTAVDGNEALEKARILHPDVILMDVYMPNCNGLEATRNIKAELPDIQIVMLTTSEDDDTLFAAIKNGAAGYLLKSLDASELFEALSMLAQGEMPLAPSLASKVLDEFSSRSTRTKGVVPRVSLRKDNANATTTATAAPVTQSLQPETPATTELSATTTKLSPSDAPITQELGDSDYVVDEEDEEHEDEEHEDYSGTNGNAAEEELSERQLEILTMVAQGHTYKQVGVALNLSERTVKYHMAEIINRLHVSNRAEAIAYAVGLDKRNK